MALSSPCIEMTVLLDLIHSPSSGKSISFPHSFFATNFNNGYYNSFNCQIQRTNFGKKKKRDKYSRFSKINRKKQSAGYRLFVDHQFVSKHVGSGFVLFLTTSLFEFYLTDDFLDNAALEAGDYQSKLDNDPVQLMTIHSAKGLEFPVVFLTGLEEGIFPNENRKGGEDFLEEERRLCYVAITRAMKSLYITFANARYLHGSYNYLMPSRFISEIPDELLESVKSDNYQHVKSKNVIPLRKKDDHKHGFKIGQRVKHQKFGTGVVLSYEGEDDNLKLYINFEDYGSKWLVLTYAHLEFL